ncbi:MAG: glycosyltransferase [Phycisphaerales bacterium]|nr:glycosyltransferase [Phycisphaerales bacterium]
MTIRPQDVSLYIPARDTARTIAAAIESVRKQTVTPARFFVILDSRSSDDSAAIVRETGVEVVEQTSGRLGHGRNIAIESCRTPWLASCDADVTLEPDWMAALIDAANQPLRANARIAAVGGGTLESLHTPADAWRSVNMPHNWGPAGFDNPFMLVSEMMARVDVLRDIGGYLPDLRYGEDSDLCQRLRHADYTLRYTPHAKAWHDRRDTPGSVLNLRWAYSYNRQRPRFESIPGLIEKLDVNRSYVIQSLSQTLHSDQIETIALSLAIWFHHAVRDLREALSRWPLLDEQTRRWAEARLWRALCEASPACVQSTLTRFAKWIDIAEAVDSAASQPETRLLKDYFARVAQATAALCQEIPDETLIEVMRSALVIDGAIKPERSPNRLSEPPATATFRSERPNRAAWAWNRLAATLNIDMNSVSRIHVCGPVLNGEMPSGLSESQPPRGICVTLAPHLELADNPLVALRNALSRGDRVAVGYQSPTRFAPSALFLTPRDIASECAMAGFEILDFHAEAGLTRVVAERKQEQPNNRSHKLATTPPELQTV